MSPELRAALSASSIELLEDGCLLMIGAIHAILRYAECNDHIPDRALCQCWGDVIKAAIPAALWDRVSTEG